jgi:hypothetical protein
MDGDSIGTRASRQISDQWLDHIEKMFRAAKPMMDFMNSVIDDYE